MKWNRGGFILNARERRNMDSVNEISKRWIFTERALKSIERGLVLNVNRPQDIPTAATTPVLAYQNADAERFEVIHPWYGIVVLIRVHTDMINDQEPKLCGKRPFDHVVRNRRSRG